MSAFYFLQTQMTFRKKTSVINLFRVIFALYWYSEPIRFESKVPFKGCLQAQRRTKFLPAISKICFWL